MAYESRSTSSKNPWTMASSRVLPAARPLESAWIWPAAEFPLWKKYNRLGGRYLKRWSRSDQNGDHSILADGSNGAGVGMWSESLGGVLCSRYCASLNSSTSFGRMASPAGK